MPKFVPKAMPRSLSCPFSTMDWSYHDACFVTQSHSRMHIEPSTLPNNDHNNLSRSSTIRTVRYAKHFLCNSCQFQMERQTTRFQLQFRISESNAKETLVLQPPLSIRYAQQAIRLPLRHLQLSSASLWCLVCTVPLLCGHVMPSSASTYLRLIRAMLPTESAFTPI